MTNVFDELQRRGFVAEATEGVRDLLGTSGVVGYIGFDPTAASFHVGSLLPILSLMHLQRSGHAPIALMGGGTGMIGDPSGKSTERPLLTPQQVAEHGAGLKAQLERFLDFKGRHAARLLDNSEWLAPERLIDFLREVGKHFTVNYMTQKESVKRRLEAEAGLSYTEFSYMLLQAYDFLQLYRRTGCRLQLGGTDQWGNITAGIELVRRVAGAKVHGLVMPLLTTSAGGKFGKSEAGTVWLDPALTSPYRFYQYFVNTEDTDAVRFLRLFTLLDDTAMREAEEALAAKPAERAAQRLLAREVTRMVHGETAVAAAERATQVLFGGDVAGLGAAELLEVFADVPTARLPRSRFEGAGTSLVELLPESGLAKSKSEARRLIEGGGIYVNSARAASADEAVTAERLIEGKVLVLRKGKREYCVIEVMK